MNLKDFLIQKTPIFFMEEKSAVKQTSAPRRAKNIGGGGGGGRIFAACICNAHWLGSVDIYSNTTR
jgi:hypothetical protein